MLLKGYTGASYLSQLDPRTKTEVPLYLVRVKTENQNSSAYSYKKKKERKKEKVHSDIKLCKLGSWKAAVLPAALTPESKTQIFISARFYCQSGIWSVRTNI